MIQPTSEENLSSAEVAPTTAELQRLHNEWLGLLDDIVGGRSTLEGLDIRLSNENGIRVGERGGPVSLSLTPETDENGESALRITWLTEFFAKETGFQGRSTTLELAPSGVTSAFESSISFDGRCRPRTIIDSESHEANKADIELFEGVFRESNHRRSPSREATTRPRHNKTGFLSQIATRFLG